MTILDYNRVHDLKRAQVRAEEAENRIALAAAKGSAKRAQMATKVLEK